MMWLKWLPWRFVVRRVARDHGFLDPIALLARLRRFAQPSEVHEPIELLRAGVPRIEVRVPGFNPIIVKPDQHSIKLYQRPKS